MGLILQGVLRVRLVSVDVSTDSHFFFLFRALGTDTLLGVMCFLDFVQICSAQTVSVLLCGFASSRSASLSLHTFTDHSHAHTHAFLLTHTQGHADTYVNTTTLTHKACTQAQRPHHASLAENESGT